MSVDYRVTIKSLPEELRPRERLYHCGPEALSDTELLAILLRTGTDRLSALDLAEELLARFEGLRGLVAAGLEELASVRGMGPAKVAQTKAALELGRRLAASPTAVRPCVHTPEDGAALVMEDFRHLDREHFGVMLLNTKNQVLAVERVAVGTLNTTTVHPREIFKCAVRRSAAAMILVHNHPSGDPTPSRQDLELTRRLAEAGEIMGISVLDHLVIGDNRFISLKKQGYL